jgi:cyclopropane fatty-acyl-phospholipid synthase-like methyltransferase
MEPASNRVDFDAAYTGTPPWDIGRPQPAIERLAADGMLRGTVLDAGCGTGEHALMAASLGLRAVGVDASPRAITRAEGKAAERGLDVRFVVGDALDLSSLGESFETVIDSGLFHVFDDADRARYVDSLRSVVPQGGRAFVLCFSDRVPGTMGPRRITEREIRTSFADGWEVASIEITPMQVLFGPGSIPAWLAVVERT